MGTHNLNIQLQHLEKGLIKYVHSLNLDNEDQELVQGSFLNAVTKKSMDEKSEFLNSWTKTLEEKAFINNYRRILMLKPAANTEQLFILYKDENSKDVDSIYGLINKKIDHLDKKLIDPFRMYVEGFSYNEIAARKKLKAETVKSRIFMARSQLMIQE